MRLQKGIVDAYSVFRSPPMNGFVPSSHLKKGGVKAAEKLLKIVGRVPQRATYVRSKLVKGGRLLTFRLVG